VLHDVGHAAPAADSNLLHDPSALRAWVAMSLPTMRPFRRATSVHRRKIGRPARLPVVVPGAPPLWFFGEIPSFSTGVLLYRQQLAGRNRKALRELPVLRQYCAHCG
jgi:hypothetical protein